MKSFFQETRSLATGFVLGALVLGGGSIALAAWTAPTGAPPTSNIALPVNTSSTTQYKGGALGIGGLFKAYLGIDANSQRITAVATPSAGTDAANKDYVDAFAQGGGAGSVAGGKIVFKASRQGLDYAQTADGEHYELYSWDGTFKQVLSNGGNWESVNPVYATYERFVAMCNDLGSGWRPAMGGDWVKGDVAFSPNELPAGANKRNGNTLVTLGNIFGSGTFSNSSESVDGPNSIGANIPNMFGSSIPAYAWPTTSYQVLCVSGM